MVNRRVKEGDVFTTPSGNKMESKNDLGFWVKPGDSFERDYIFE